MADYPTTPHRLSTIADNSPQDSEDSTKLGAVMRQTREVFKALLGKIVDDDGNLKVIATLASGSVGTAELKTAPNGVGTGNINDAAVTLAKMHADSVDTDQICDGAVETAQLGTAAVTSAKIGTGEVKTANIDNDAVTSDKLADHATTDASRAVTTNHIRDGAVTADKIGTGAVTVAKLASMSSGNILIGTGSAVKAVAPHAESVVIPTYDSAGDGTVKFTFGAGFNPALQDFAILSCTQGGSAELSVTTAAAGVPGALVWNTRPQAGSFTKEYDPRGLVTIELVTISGVTYPEIKFAGQGNYYVEYYFSVSALNTNAVDSAFYTKLRFKSFAPTSRAELELHRSNTSILLLDNANFVTQQVISGRGVINIPAAGTNVRIEQAVLWKKATTWTTKDAYSHIYGEYDLDPSNYLKETSVNQYNIIYIRKLSDS